MNKLNKCINQTFGLLLGALLLWGAPLAAEEAPNLIANPGFESYTHQSAVFPFPELDEFADWGKTGYSTNAEKTDVYGGSVSLKLGTTAASSIYQVITGLTDDDYEANAQFVLTLHYKVVSLSSGGSVSIDSYWEHATEFEGLKTHDAEKLQRVLSDTVQSEWQTLVIETTRPAKAKSFMLQLTAKANCYVLFDDFSFVYKKKETPYIIVTPDKLDPVYADIGTEKAFTTLKIKQGYVTSPTTFRIASSNEADIAQFKISATSMAETESELELIITYAPTSKGVHEANLVFDNKNHTTILPNMIALKGTCIDPSLPPSVTVTPTTLPVFETVVGKDVKNTVHITTRNCTDWVYLKIDHIKGVGFTISDASGLVGKNDDRDISLTFHPVEEGECQSTLTVYSQINEFDPIVVTLNGKAEAKSEGNIDWLTEFKWDLSSPRKMLNETFDGITHNETVVIEGWQNVAALDQRPWWGFDEDKTSPKRGDGKYAKATSYQYGISSTGTWTSWLVTPPLDYKNAEGKIFTFSVMCEYQPDEGSESKLEVYYIDANIDAKKDTVFFQDLTESFEIPKIGDENLTWRTFQLDLSPYDIADIFHMGFRFEGPNGGDGAPTYYIDDVSWGRTDLPELSVTPSYIIDSAAVVGKELTIGELTISSKNLTDSIELKLAGSNYNRFSLSTAKLPKEGGKVLVSFLGKEAGVHEAYVELSSKNAATKFVPLAVRCNASEGIDGVESQESGARKIMREGQMIIVRDGKEYNVLGVRLF